MESFRFYKDPDGRWYVDLPEYQGSKQDLEMVSGADAFLEILAQGEAMCWFWTGRTNGWVAVIINWLLTRALTTICSCGSMT
jgi:hypothetical protein